MSPPTFAGRAILEAILTRGAGPTTPEAEALAAVGATELEDALEDLVRDHGERGLAVLATLGAEGSERVVRRAARRVLYRLGRSTPAAPPSRPVVTRRPERAVRAWLSGIDGTGSRAVWILFEGGWGDLRLCSLLVNDTAGILDVAGGEITKKRLGRELDALRASQKLPWVETDPARALGLVGEALALHRVRGDGPPAAFARWAPAGEAVTPPPPPAPSPDADHALVERSGELLALPELAGWFLDPDRVQADAVEQLQARQSRLVVSDQIRAEREAEIVSRVVERELDEPARRLWARRLLEMALVFEAEGRGEHAALARAAATALVEPRGEPRHHPFARGLAARALDAAGEVALGRLRAADVSRAPRAPGRAAPPR